MLKRLLMTVFVLALAGFALWVNVTKPRILILQSYGTDYIWAAQVEEGLRRALADAGDVAVKYQYMKTKRFHGKEALRRAGIAARDAIDRIRPDVVIAVDDYAQALAAKYYVNRPNIRIVFAGVNGSVKPYGYDKANNVTGIFERKPAAALRELIMTLGREAGLNHPRALFLRDEALSGDRDDRSLRAFDWAPVRYLPSLKVSDYQAWKAAVLGAKKHTDYLLVGGYRKLPRKPGDQRFVSAREVMTWTEAHSPVPVIGMNVFNTGDGAMLSVGVSPYEQGEVAARMALQILHGKSPRAIPEVTPTQFVVALRQSALDRRHLHLPGVYAAFARATNNYYP